MTIVTLKIENDNLLNKILDKKEKDELVSILKNDQFISLEEFAKKHNL